MSLSPITTQQSQTLSQTTAAQELPASTTSRPFDKATKSLAMLFMCIQKASSLDDKKAAVIQLHHEITFLRNACLQDRREVLVAHQHLTKQKLEILEFSELQRGREMEAQIDALMQQTTRLLDAELQAQFSFYPQGARSKILPFYEESIKVLKITAHQTQFERDWYFAKCLYEEGELLRSIDLIKRIPLPNDIQKSFDLITASPTKEKLGEFFQFAEQAKTRELIQTFSLEKYQPKTLADVLSHPTIMKAFLRYVNPVTIMRLNTACHESAKQKLSKGYAETHAKKAKDLSTFSLTSAPIVCRNLLPTALAALWQNGLEYQNLDPKLQNNVGVAKIALVSIVQKGINANFEKLVSLFPEHIKTSLTDYIRDINANTSKYRINLGGFKKHGLCPYTLFLAEMLTIIFQNDKDIFRIMAQISGSVLTYASVEIRNDPELVTLSVQNNGYALIAASNRLKNDKAIVMAAVSQIGLVLASCNQLKDDIEIVTAAVTQYGRALQYASDRLKNTEAIVMAALAENADALQYASDRLKDSETIVMAAVTENADTLRYASDRLKDNEEFIRVMVTKNWTTLQYASDRLQKDEAIVMIVDKLKDTEAAVMAVVAQNGKALEFVSDRLKDDEAIVRTAISQNGYALEYASDRLKDNEAIVSTAVSQNVYALRYASDRLQDNEAIVIAAITQKADALIYASNRLKDNEAIVRLALAQDKKALQFASNRLRAMLHT